MIGDKLTYHPTYKDVTSFVISKLKDILIDGNRICISVGGESGCGKTSLAYALQVDIEKQIGLKGFVFHLDDYFKLVPLDNYNARLKNINQVGVSEVNMELLNAHLVKFKESKGILSKPLVNYHQNAILSEDIFTSQSHFCIVEGTYVSTLEAPNYKIFMETTYIDTVKSRIKRGRDNINEFNEQVLEIEHQIIKPHYKLADLIIDKDLNTLIKK